MITNRDSGTCIDEIAEGIYRVSTPSTKVPGGFTFNQFLIIDDDPLLFHTGLRQLFPLVHEANHEVLIRGYVDEVVISCGAEVIARHARSYVREDFVFDPLHYLALLEHKVGALDQAAPLVGWDLPEEFATLRRLLEARIGKRGKREFVQILRLLEVFRPEEVL